MKIVSLVMRASLLLALSSCVCAAAPQAANNQAALMKQSSIVFSGTVSQLGTTSFAEVPKSAQTVVVHVEAVLKKPAAVSLKKGDSVTVEVKDPAAFQEGMQATFYTEGWIFGSGVAVKELGHELVPSGAAGKTAGAAEKAPVQTPEQFSDQELRDRINKADFVVVGRVTDVRRWNVPKSAKAYHVTEHDPDWHEAVVAVQSVLKGGKIKGNKVIVRFPQRNDVAWVHTPKFAKNQQGIFCLNRDQTTGAPMTGGQKGNVYTCLGHGDSLPMSEEARVRSLLRNQ